MEIAPLQNHAAAPDLPLERLADSPHLTEQEKVAEASRQFEALLLHQILQQTQKTIIPSEYADNSTATGIYRDLVTHQLADSISRSGALGLAQTFAQQLNHTSHSPLKAGPGSAPPASLAARTGTVARPELPPPAGPAAGLHSSIRSRRAPASLLNPHE